ncbi:Uncharacterised protein [Mycobacteroides abscessus subsp. abscessus]|nr:Uncharacterised protein [Mycobacteroides abscessus subsp. abscessus]
MKKFGKPAVMMPRKVRTPSLHARCRLPASWEERLRPNSGPVKASKPMPSTIASTS